MKRHQTGALGYVQENSCSYSCSGAGLTFDARSLYPVFCSNAPRACRLENLLGTVSDGNSSAEARRYHAECLAAIDRVQVLRRLQCFIYLQNKLMLMAAAACSWPARHKHRFQCDDESRSRMGSRKKLNFSSAKSLMIDPSWNPSPPILVLSFQLSICACCVCARKADRRFCRR